MASRFWKSFLAGAGAGLVEGGANMYIKNKQDEKKKVEEDQRIANEHAFKKQMAELYKNNAIDVATETAKAKVEAAKGAGFTPKSSVGKEVYDYFGYSSIPGGKPYASAMDRMLRTNRYGDVGPSPFGGYSSSSPSVGAPPPGSRAARSQAAPSHGGGLSTSGVAGMLGVGGNKAPASKAPSSKDDRTLLLNRPTPSIGTSGVSLGPDMVQEIIKNAQGLQKVFADSGDTQAAELLQQLIIVASDPSNPNSQEAIGKIQKLQSAIGGQ